MDEVKERASQDKGKNRAFWLQTKDYMIPEFEEAWGRLGNPAGKEFLPMTATGFDVGEVLEEFKRGKVTVRKHVSGSFTTLVDGVLVPARQHLIAIRNEMGLPDKVTNTTRSLGVQIFGAL